MNDLSTTQAAWGAAVLVIAYLVRGIAGFGSGMIAVPLLTLAFPLSMAVPLVVFLDYVASAAQGVANRRDIRWREIFALLPFSLIGVACALFFLRNVDLLWLTRALGLFIIVFAIYTLSGYTPKPGAARGWAALAGASGGLIGTLFGTGGPFYVTYFKVRDLDKQAFRATFAATFLMDGAARLVGYAAGGFLTGPFLLLLATALPLMAVSLYVGGHIHTAISQATFQRGISALLIVSGVLLLLR